MVVCTDVAAHHVRMEVEYDTLTQCKEDGDGALLQSQESDVGSAADSPMQIDHGQLQIVHLRQPPPSCH